MEVVGWHLCYKTSMGGIANQECFPLRVADPQKKEEAIRRARLKIKILEKQQYAVSDFRLAFVEPLPKQKPEPDSLPEPRILPILHPTF